ncbi:MAG: SDR family oxidoreductase [Caldilinea sp.]|nr:SDR family oxidoreductase [Caldilinea sp.]MCB0152361.1 SDR family oxidoreductase [Caldilineaceae bacterium]MCB9114978.1 SDR family oxidoreductase [Caldilineaceae bacterium]MCB9120535.1 SDR family oxidoreductase [Caldilineaceae bacterium]MCB9126213.1 SDR family oxidoreductase [Caldilineaceae bacterium]
MEIKDSVVLITGGAIRLGRAHGLHLARKGAHVAFSYLPGEPWAATKQEIEALGVRCAATELDVRNLEAMRRWVAATAETFGRIDVLINNASPWLMRPFLEVTEAEYDLCNDVTVKAAFFCTQAVAPIMLRQGRGVIVNVADLSVYEVWPGLGHHAIAKAGVVQLTRYAARELSPTIRVNAVAPGPVLLPPDFTPEQIEDARQHTLVKRLGAPEDVSRMIALLIEHDYLTGHVYFIDGGELFTH